jgi:hypothetical protein
MARHSNQPISLGCSRLAVLDNDSQASSVLRADPTAKRSRSKSDPPSISPSEPLCVNWSLIASEPPTPAGTVDTASPCQLAGPRPSSRGEIHAIHD